MDGCTFRREHVGESACGNNKSPFEAPAQTFAAPMEFPPVSGAAYFCGDTSFFSLNWALHAIGARNLPARCGSFWDREPVESSRAKANHSRHHARSGNVLRGSADHTGQHRRNKSRRGAPATTRHELTPFSSRSRNEGIDHPRTGDAVGAALRTKTLRPAVDRAARPFHFSSKSDQLPDFARMSDRRMTSITGRSALCASFNSRSFGEQSGIRSQLPFPLTPAMDLSACKTCA